MSEKIDPRADERELLQRIQAGNREVSIVSLVKLLEIRLIRLQNNMLDCPYEEFPKLQAEAKLTSKLIRELKPQQI